MAIAIRRESAPEGSDLEGANRSGQTLLTPYYDRWATAAPVMQEEGALRRQVTELARQLRLKHRECAGLRQMLDACAQERARWRVQEQWRDRANALAAANGALRADLAETVEDATGLTGEMVQSPRLAPVIHAIYTAELVAALEVVRRAGVHARRYLQEEDAL